MPDRLMADRVRNRQARENARSIDHPVRPPERSNCGPASGIGQLAQPGTGADASQEAEARLAAERGQSPRSGPPSFDLSHVRVHTDPAAAARAQALRAAAFTLGRDVYFAAGRFRPDTEPGRALIAHELAHVSQQHRDGRTRLQLAPETTAGPQATGPKQATGSTQQAPGAAASGDLRLPWSHGDYNAFEVTSSGVRFLVALPKEGEKEVRAAIPRLARQISTDNDRIPASARVMTCFITASTTRYTSWKGKPALILNPPDDVNRAAVAHEMGHARFFALTQAQAGPAGSAAPGHDVALRVADLYLRLEATNKPPDLTKAAGLMMVDPSWWSPGAKSEHPWSDPDEFFASAKEAYQVNPKGLRASIARAEKVDPAIHALGAELLAMLDALYGKGSMPAKTLPKDRTDAAEQELAGLSVVSPVEDSDHELYPQLHYLLHPDARPGT
jgi:Domain of unknown function (DUF4157)